jgi:predicted dehydrogenase
VADTSDNRLQHAKSVYPQLVTAHDYRDLFRLDLDAVAVATPPATHFRLAKDCLEHGLHVLVEKPLTLNSDEALELVELAARLDLRLMVGHTFEYNPAVRKVKEIIDSAELGRILYIHTMRVNLGLFQPGLNVLWDLAPHDISILRFILSCDPITISAQGADCIFAGKHDVAYLHLTFPGRIAAHVHVSWLDPCKVRRITVVGTSKMLVYDDVETLEKIKIYDKGVEAPPYTDNFGDFQCSYRYGDAVIPHIQFTEPLRIECEEFISCIADGRREPLTSGVDGLRVVQILEAAQRSLLNGGHYESLGVAASRSHVSASG